MIQRSKFYFKIKKRKDDIEILDTKIKEEVTSQGSLKVKTNISTKPKNAELGQRVSNACISQMWQVIRPYILNVQEGCILKSKNEYLNHLF